MLLDIAISLFQAKEQVDEAKDEFSKQAAEAMTGMAGNPGQETITLRFAEKVHGYADQVAYNWSDHTFQKWQDHMSQGSSESAMDATSVISEVGFEIMSAMVDAIQQIAVGAAIDIAMAALDDDEGSHAGAKESASAARSKAMRADDMMSQREMSSFSNRQSKGESSYYEIDKAKVRSFAKKASNRRTPEGRSREFRIDQKAERGKKFMKTKNRRRKDGTADPMDAIQAAAARLASGPTHQQHALFMEIRHNIGWMRPTQITDMGMTIVGGRALRDPHGSLFRMQQRAYLDALAKGERLYNTLRTGQKMNFDYGSGRYTYTVPDTMDGYNPYTLQRQMYLGQYDSRGQYGMPSNYVYPGDRLSPDAYRTVGGGTSYVNNHPFNGK